MLFSSTLARILIGVFAAIMLYFVGMFIFLVVLFSITPPEAYVECLSVDPATYANVESIEREDLTIRAYAYERNQYVDAFPDLKTPPVRFMEERLRRPDR